MVGVNTVSDDAQLSHTAKKTKPPNPPPVGKAGFDVTHHVWVLTKGGLVSVQHCRLYRTVQYTPISLGRYVEPSGARVYRYGPVTKSELS